MAVQGQTATNRRPNNSTASPNSKVTSSIAMFEGNKSQTAQWKQSPPVFKKLTEKFENTNQVKKLSKVNAVKSKFMNTDQVKKLSKVKPSNASPPEPVVSKTKKTHQKKKKDHDKKKKSKSELAKMDRLRREATKIQAAARGMIQRNKPLESKNDSTAEQQQQEESPKLDTSSPRTPSSNVGKLTHKGVLQIFDPVAVVQACPKSARLLQMKTKKRREAARKDRDRREAIKIQAAYRGMVQRKIFVSGQKQELAIHRANRSATKIQAVFRGTFQQRKYLRERRLVKLQAVCRGFVPRCRYRLNLLEKKLGEVEERRVSELRAVDERVERELAEFKKAEKARLQAERDEAISHECNKAIAYWRNANEELSDENELLREEIKILAEKNQDLKEGKDATPEEYAMLRKRQRQVKRTRKELDEALKTYEEQLQAYQEAIAKRKINGDLEAKLHKLYSGCANSVIGLMEKRCSDSALVCEITEITIECGL